MRKRTIREIWDSLFWAIIYLLPIIFAIIFYFKFTNFVIDTNAPLYDPVPDFVATFRAMIFNFVDYQNPLLEMFQEVLGVMHIYEGDSANAEEYFLFGYDSAILAYLTYCVMVTIAHVVYDVMVFIPRLSHKWLGKATQQD